jgi:hypothetical protein
MVDLRRQLKDGLRLITDELSKPSAVNGINHEKAHSGTSLRPSVLQLIIFFAEM